MSGALTFSASWMVIALSVVAWVVLAGFGLLNWRRSGGRRGVVVLEILRLALAGLVVVTLWRPELRRTSAMTNAPSVVVLRDASRSMTTQDLPGENNQPMSRRDWVDAQKGAAFWGPLSNQFKVVTEDFSAAVTNTDV